MGCFSLTSGAKGSRLATTGSIFPASGAAPVSGLGAVALAGAALAAPAFFFPVAFFAGFAGVACVVCAAAEETRQNDIVSTANSFAVVFASVIVIALPFCCRGSGVGAAGCSPACVKKVVIVKVPVTEVPGDMWNLLPLPLVAIPESFKSPTLIIRDRRPKRAKKSRTAK